MTVKLYSLSTCPHCNKTKVLLNEQGDLAGQEEASHILDEVIRMTGRKAFPVILINDQVIQGYDPVAIINALHSEK